MLNEGDLNPHMVNALFVARAFRELLRRWDGGTEQLAYFIDSNEGAVVGYCTDDHAAGILTSLLQVLQDEEVAAPFSTRCGGASLVAEVAHQLRESGPSDRVRVLLLGWGTCKLFHVDTAQWRDAARASCLVDEAATVADCFAAEDAARRIHHAHAALDARGVRAVELERLKSTIGVRWEDFAAMTLAIARARAEVATFLATPEGDQAVALLDFLAELIARRPVGPCNALGGCA